MADRVGQQLGNYHLIRFLGEGGFAEVYLGEHLYLGTQAAIKVLSTQLTREEAGQFQTEARIIARLIHPHIVRVLDFGIEGKTPFLVMDYAPQGTLRKLHPKGTRLPLGESILSYVKQVAAALQYAHEEKVIHRDVKPENLLLGRSHEILLSDFGIALLAQSSRYQSTQEMAGTMAYMAPEQIQGHPRPASDQYSLGIVVYEWLSGDRPFHGSMTEIVAQHLAVEPPALHEKVPTIPPAVEQVVMTALAKDPYQRFGSVHAFATALEQASQALRPASVPPQSVSPPPAPQKPTEPPPSPTASTVAAPSPKPPVSVAPPPPVRATPAPRPVPSLAPTQLAATPALPKNSVWGYLFPLFTGIPGGILVLLISLLFYHRSFFPYYPIYFVDLVIFSYYLLILLILLWVVSAAASFITSKYVRRRVIGLLAGLVTGSSWIGASWVASTIVGGPPAAVSLVPWLLIVPCGPFSWLAAWLATRKHSH